MSESCHLGSEELLHHSHCVRCEQ